MRPSSVVVLAALGGAATLVLTGWLFVRPPSAPAYVPDDSHIAAAGPADLTVLDGDTLRLGDAVVRLAGITAPARGTNCHGHGPETFDCGVAAANALAALVRGGRVKCVIRGHDPLGRPVGNCETGRQALSQALVDAGWARATIAELRPAEAAARSAERGIWHPANRS